MDSSRIPERLLEPVCSLYRKCRGAQEGTRLPQLQEEVKAEFPDLSEADLLEASRITAKIIVEQIDPTEEAFVRKAAQRTLQRTKW